MVRRVTDAEVANAKDALIGALIERNAEQKRAIAAEKEAEDLRAALAAREAEVGRLREAVELFIYRKDAEGEQYCLGCAQFRRSGHSGGCPNISLSRALADHTP